MKKILSLVILVANSIVVAAQWTASGASIHNSNTGNVGIGTGAILPNATLSVKGRIGVRADANPSTPTETMRVEGAIATEENVFNVTNLSDQDFNVRLSATGASTKRTIIGPSTTTRLSLGVGVTSGNEYLTVINGGNVGIGTTSPSAKLHVVGPNTGSGTTIFADGGGDVVLNGGGSLFFDGNYSYGSGNYIRPVAANTQAYFTSGQERIRITPTGNVGVGTTSPAQKLDVAGNMKFSDKAYFGNWTLGATGQWPTNPGLGYSGGDETFGIFSSGGQISLQIDGAFRQAEPGKVNYFMDKVGIGTTNPGSYQLAVEGKIGAREVNVTAANPWPDFVFEKNYKLPSLDEVKNYIDQNQHLPEVPSAKEVEKNGVNLGEMNALLLKKIEELTLHIIKQEERIKALEVKAKE